ncbi:MAG: glycosyltransferase family 4 protein [Phormidesmis sp.]
MANHANLDILVAYCSMQGAEAGYDPGFGRDIAWDVPLLDGYPWVQLKNKASNPGLHRFWGLNNPDLWSFIHKEKFDAVILLTGYIYLSFWIALIAAKLTRTPVMFGTDSHQLTSRDKQLWKAWIKRWVWFYLFGLADVVAMPSSGGVALMRSIGLPEKKIVLTPYVIDNDWWTAQSKQVDRSAVRQQWDIPDNAVVVLFCAKLQPWKCPNDVLEAFIRADVDNTYLVFVGDGSLRSPLEQRAIEAGTADRVKFLGFANQSQMPAIYTSSDVFVLPSEYEPFGVVVNEAMLCGCPVIVSDRVGARYDLVREGETGFVYPVRDIKVLTNILQKVLKNPEQLNPMKKLAAKHLQAWSPLENVEAFFRAVSKACTSIHYR